MLRGSYPLTTMFRGKPWIVFLRENTASGKASYLQGRVKSQRSEYLTWGVREELGLLEAEETMLTLGFMLRSLSSWYMRSRSTSGRLRKFCMALRLTKRDWDKREGRWVTVPSQEALVWPTILQLKVPIQTVPILPGAGLSYSPFIA